MKNPIKLLLLLATAITLTFTSCKKEPEPIKGCTDKDSKNYNAEATVSDGSCRFEGSVVIWYNKELSDALAAAGVTTLKYYVDGVFIGSTGNQYYTAAPNCGQNATMTITKDLGSVKLRTYPYKILDQNDQEIDNGTLSFEGNTCVKFELN